MRYLSNDAEALLKQLLEWEKLGESLEDNLWTIIENEGKESATLELAKRLKITGFISWQWADNRIYWVGINDKAR
ncbi:MAG: hypothetical protein QM401_04945 [Bacillota bacterium]|nr:hypothetical protein [Bacillota bacterium]